MPNARQEASLTQIRRLLARWDQGGILRQRREDLYIRHLRLGSPKIRRQILLDFIQLHSTITEPELESEFAQSASLFFTRISKSSFVRKTSSRCLELVRVSLVAAYQLPIRNMSQRTTARIEHLSPMFDRQ